MNNFCLLKKRCKGTTIFSISRTFLSFFKLTKKYYKLSVEKVGFTSGMMCQQHWSYYQSLP